MTEHFSKRKVGGEEAMAGLYAQCAGSTVGGGSGFRAVGGVMDLKDYTNSIMSKAKEKLIRDIARDMKDKFKVESGAKSKLSINPDADLQTLISQLKAAIPDPQTNGRTWSDKLGSQKSACKKLAQIINSHYGYASGHAVINENAEPEEICEKVSEVMYTLFTGLHTEFLNVREDTLRMSKNLHILENLLQRNYDHLVAKMQSADPENIGAETKLAREGHNMIMEELRRQHAMLDNTLNIVISPEDKELTKLLKQSKDFKRLVKKIKALPGTGKFGEKVAFVLSGVGTTAQMALAVNEALKKTQMSLAEYSKPKNIKELEETVFEKLRTTMNQSSARDIENYIKGARTLFRYDYSRPEIIAELSKRGGEDEDDAAHGAEEDVVGGMKLDKRVKDRQELKKALVVAFNKQLGGYLERVNVLTEKIARATGTSVPVTDALRQFTKRLELIPDIEKRNIFYALTGFYNDPASKEERGLFLDNVKALCDSLEKMMKMSEYSKNEHVRDLLRAWQGVIALVHDYVDRFTKGFGPINPKVSPSKYEGMSEEAILGGGPWWTATQKALERAGVKSEDEQGKIYHETIKPALIELKDKGQLNLEQLSEKVAELVSKATGKEVKAEADAQLTAEIDEAKERMAARAAAPAGEKSPAAKSKATKNKSKTKKGTKGNGEDDDDDDERSFGAAEVDEIEGGAVTASEISRMAYNLGKSKEVMRFFFRAADIRQNMKYVAPEMKEYGKDYEKVLGDAIAEVRDKITATMNEDIKYLATGTNGPNPPQYQYRATRQALEASKTGTPEEKSTYASEKLKEIAGFRRQFYTTKIDMIKCAEAMDLYMKHYSDAIVANVDEVQKVEVMLRGAEIISKWFNHRSGNLICSVFDTFPGVALGGEYKYSNLPQNYDKNGTWSDKVHYYWRVQSICRLVPLAAARTNATAQKANLATRGGKDFPDLYKTAAADWNAWFRHGDQKGLMPAQSLNAGGAPPAAGTPYVNDNVGVPGIPYMGIACCKEASGLLKTDSQYKERDAFKAMEYVTKAFQNISVLKNLIAAFVAIGDRFGGQDLRKKIHMSPSQIYDTLINYMTVGSFSMDLTPGAVAAVAISQEPNYLNNPTLTVAGSTVTSNDIRVALEHAGPSAPFSAITVSMRGQQQVLHSDMMQNSMLGTDADQMFVFVLKAMVAKILTTIGVYNMIHRPIDKNALGYTSAIRWTIGGADSFPKVIPEALELYIRLPLLAEFYRETLDFENSNQILTMVPHMDGTFQGLVELIFDRAKHIKFGTYSETDTKTMIEEINKIYMSYKGSKNVVADVMHEFVNEVNRRYGILADDERTRYKDMERERYAERYDTERGDDRTDYDILPEELGSKVGPSDAFVTQGLIPGATTQHKWHLKMQRHQDFVRQLRTKLDKSIDDIWPGSSFDPYTTSVDGMDKLRSLSFESLVKARTEELKYARSARDQFRIVQQAVNGLGEFSMNVQERALILFHETVVAGLNAMKALHKMVSEFHDGVWKIANTIKRVKKFCSNNAPTMANLNADVSNGTAHSNKQGDTEFLRTVGHGAVTLANIQAFVAVAGDSKDRGEVGARYLLDNPKIFQMFVELVQGHVDSLGGLVECQLEVIDHPDCDNVQQLKTLFEQNTNTKKAQTVVFSMDHSKLYELVERQLFVLKQMLDKFRGLLPRQIIKHYEELKDEKGVEQRGSIYWLEKHFMLELLQGKVDNWDRDHLDNVNDKARVILQHLTRPWRFDLSAFAAGGVPAHAAVFPGGGLGARVYSQDNYRVMLHELVSVNPNGASVPVLNNIAPANLRGIQRTLLVPTTNNAIPDALAGVLVPLTDVYNYTNANLEYLPEFQGLIFRFNKLVAAYLLQIYDPQSEKIYVNTINNFATGAFSDAVMKGQWYDDMQAPLPPNTQYVLFKSLALMMRQLVTAKPPGKTFKHFVESDLAEIPLFMKEGYRANMPIFIKMFTLLIKRCETLRHFVNACPVGQPPAVSEDAAKSSLNNVLNQIILGSNSLVSCMKDVLDELADSPTYLETHKDSIKEYEALNGMRPMMPMSSIYYYLQNGNWSAGMPQYSLGSNEFKLQYGTRGVLALNGEYGLSKMPGMKDILQKHNETTEAEFHLDEKTLGDHVSNTMTMLRYVIDSRYYKGWLTSKHRLGANSTINDAAATVAGNLVDLANSVREPLAISYDRAVYSLGENAANQRTLIDVLQITESSRQRDSRQKIVKRIEQSDKTLVRGTRAQIRVMNIIDMNLVPINVHALMREMPLVNLYNYSYTFDSMICSLMGLDKSLMVPASRIANAAFQGDSARGDWLKVYPEQERTRKFLGLMLMHPYEKISRHDYDTYFARVVRGAAGVTGLGRPKFLSDELYNKALFGEVYDGDRFWDEAGPAVGQGRKDLPKISSSEKLSDLFSTDLETRAQQAPAGPWVGGPFSPEHTAFNNLISLAAGDKDPSDIIQNVNFAALSAPRQAMCNATWWQKSIAAAKHSIIKALGDRYIAPNTGNLMLPGGNRNDRHLHYLYPTKDGKTEIVDVEVGDYKHLLQNIGKLRFDTFYCRSLVWLTNIQRVLRLKLHRDLEWYDARIVSDSQITTPDITELYGNETDVYRTGHFSN